MAWDLRLRRLRERAAHCRALADGAYSTAVASELDGLAADFENEAERLERRHRRPHEEPAKAQLH